MDDDRLLAARAQRWAGWSIASGLALVGGYATGYRIVTGAALLATLLCVSRWIEAARARRSLPEQEATPDDGVPPASNVIRFRRPDDQPGD